MFLSLSPASVPTTASQTSRDKAHTQGLMVSLSHSLQLYLTLPSTCFDKLSRLPPQPTADALLLKTLNKKACDRHTKTKDMLISVPCSFHPTQNHACTVKEITYQLYVCKHTFCRRYVCKHTSGRNMKQNKNVQGNPLHVLPTS